MQKYKLDTRTLDKIKKALEKVKEENIWYSEDETIKWVEEQMKRFEKNNNLTLET